MDNEILKLFIALSLVVVFIGICFTYLIWAQLKLIKVRDATEKKFYEKMQAYKEYLQNTKCDDNTIEEFKYWANHMVNMKVPRWGHCQHEWAIRLAQFDYAIVWYKKSKGEEREFIR